MTHYLEDFTELLPTRANLDEQKAILLKQAEAAGFSEFNLSRPPSLRRIGQLIDEAAAVGQNPVLH